MSSLSEIRSSRNTRISLAIIIAVAVYYGFLVYITPWFQDDINYQFNFASDTAGNSYDRISSISEIIESQANHYMTVNGRFVAHFFVQLFCGMLGHGPFAIFTSLFYVAFIFMILKLSGLGLKNIPSTVTAVIFTILSFQTETNPSCQVGYIWMYSLIMVFIWLFFKSSRRVSPLVLIPLGLFSLIIGNAHESLNIGVSAALIIYWARNRKQMTMSQYVMFICFGIGALSCCLSPGIIHRASGDTNSFSFLISFGKKMMNFVKYSTALYILAAIVGWQILHQKRHWREIYKAGPFFWNVLTVLLLFNLCIPVQGNRQLFGIELMSVILSLKLLKQHSFTRPWLYVLGAAACISLVVITEFIWRHSKYSDEITRQYLASPTGEVFIDMDQQCILTSQRQPVSAPELYNLLPDTEGPDNPYMNYDNRCLERYYTTAYPGHPPIKILPKVLEGNRHRRLPNQVIRLNPEMAVVIQDKTVASDIILKRSVDIPGFHKVMPDENISNPERYAVDADYWRAYIYDLSPFATYGRVTKREIQIVPRSR